MTCPDDADAAGLLVLGPVLLLVLAPVLLLELHGGEQPGDG